MRAATRLVAAILLALLGAAVPLGGQAQSTSAADEGSGMGDASPEDEVTGEAGRRLRIAQHNTVGWSLMTSQERSNYQKEMRSVRTYAECQAVQGEQRRIVKARAREKGITLRKPRQDACETIRARGYVD